MRNAIHKSKFPGFPPEPITNYWPYPKALNGWWYALTPREQKVLDYILRHTWGYKKVADGISLSQFINGIIKRDGTVIDKGTGIKNEKTVRKALRGLEKKGFIIVVPQVGRENFIQLKINPSQDLVSLPNNNTTPLSNNGTTSSYQEMEPTIKDISINNNNIFPAPQGNKKDTFKKEITESIAYLSKRLGGIKFPNYGKQAKYTKSMLSSGYSLEDICWAIDTMLTIKWWQENSFDMKNIADEIPKLMTRTFKNGGKK
ncbi:MAG: hypothetical protein A3F31_00585 [Candidatus Levybacteria bacterium RIFCSPHIGHO2_12_FULL_38_12]|nr:MAG: hypothetical protein A2770_02880 [Candidatus Levybacteria bacterium RIFCSPHIGHO2_01_FULL_38_12]OGH22762.1 MAG: hypothetical protein A3F31_00585 [Candidatus Levybacteria bacterium RIFCSPHIGHO2_12_FULL_38_12]OGH45015.1 MAG: hypothetical protein A3J14_04020 [Candidatus Levybacteria bacterium RIFCSPLOWO2_02_FULL_37_18]